MTEITKSQLPATTGTAKELLAAYDPNRFNVLQPPTLTVAEDDYELTLSAIHVNPTDREHCYPTPGKQGYVSLHAYILMTMAAAAGLSIGPSRIERSTDGNATTATCSGIVQDGPGSRRVISASYCVDVPARAEELRLAAEKKTDPEQRQRAMANLPAEVARLRRFATQLADSGAQARVIRKALHIRSAYTTKEITRPFIVSQVHFKPRDPHLRMAQELMLQWTHENLFEPEEGKRPVSEREATLARALLAQADVDPVAPRPAMPPPQIVTSTAARPTTDQTKDQPTTSPKPHWIDDDQSRKQFWGRVRSRGLSNTDVHTLMNIQHIHDWTGTATDLIAAIDTKIAEITSHGETPMAESHELVEDDEE